MPVEPPLGGGLALGPVQPLAVAMQPLALPMEPLVVANSLRSEEEEEGKPVAGASAPGGSPPQGQDAAVDESGDPITLLSFFHTAIKRELEHMAKHLAMLLSAADYRPQVAGLAGRWRFLHSTYRAHCSAEDQVIFPALDARVKNIAGSYGLEHEDEDRLFSSVSSLYAAALAEEDDTKRAEHVLQLVCATEAIQTTMRQHFFKEGEQVIPPLARLLSRREQAALVWGFLCCMPLSLLKRFLPWVSQHLAPHERHETHKILHAVVPSPKLYALFSAWTATPFDPTDSEGRFAENDVATSTWKVPYGVPAEVGGAVAGSVAPAAAEQAPVGWAELDGMGDEARAASEVEVKGERLGSPRSPIHELVHIHTAIKWELDQFAADVRSLRGLESAPSEEQLLALADRLDYVASLCNFHSAAEDEVVFPAVSIRADDETSEVALAAFEPEHCAEREILEHVSGLLSGPRLRGGSPRGPGAADDGRRDGPAGRASQEERARDQEEALVELCVQAEAAAEQIVKHMRDEEIEVLPLVERHFTAAEQRRLVWGLLRAMPLRLLERVLPRVAAVATKDEVAAMARNMQLAASGREEALAELFSQWLSGNPEPERGSASNGADAFGPVLRGQAPERVHAAGSGSDDSGASEHTHKRARLDHGRHGSGSSAGAVDLDMADDGSSSRGAVASKSTRASSPPGLLYDKHASRRPSRLARTARADSSTTANPIDHIFQFHKAIRKEMGILESSAAAYADVAANGDDDECLRQFAGRFFFLWGMYKAHSNAEDEIVFPALEAKEALHNVSHSYVLDHQHEEQLFDNIGKVLKTLGVDPSEADRGPGFGPRIKASSEEGAGVGLVGDRKAVAARLPPMCAALRVSLERHVANEEEELWPLFAAHFTATEQDAIIGRIVGRTGAEVLQAMLPFVTNALSVEEKSRMIESMRQAAKHTLFEQWLAAWWSGEESVPTVTANSDRLRAADATTRVEASGVAESCTAAQTERGAEDSGGWSGAASLSVPHTQNSSATMDRLAEVLNDSGVGRATVPGLPGHSAVDVPGERPFKAGWEDIFRMNQRELEAAIRRVSQDDSLDQRRKAYLIQNLMASKWIVAQQGRSASASFEGSAPAATSPPPAAVEDVGAGGAVKVEASDRTAQGGAHRLPAALAPSKDKAQVPRNSGVAAAEVDAPLGMAAAKEPQMERKPSDAASLPPGGRLAVPSYRRYHDAERGILGCEHYKRASLIKAPCCGEWFTCRLCHDEAKDHLLDRHKVAQMQCMHCGVVQPVQQKCASASCGRVLSRYYCPICKFHDDAPGKDIYHCPFCNICRVGKGLGIDTFHCMACNACMSLSLSDHRCKERSLEGNCPICCDLLFTSTEPVKALPCSHVMHSACFKAYTREYYTCPICRKSLGDMSVYFGMLDALLAAEQLPEEYKDRRQLVLCNDCGKAGETGFHFVYFKCPNTACGSYNTTPQ